MRHISERKRVGVVGDRFGRVGGCGVCGVGVSEDEDEEVDWGFDRVRRSREWRL